MSEQETPQERAARYRNLAREAQSWAKKCVNEETKAEFLKLVAEWLQMAAEADKAAGQNRG